MTDAPPIDFDAEPLRPEWAIQEHNAEELQRSLASGWQLRRIASKASGSNRELVMALRVVATGWSEGWLLLAQYMPDLRDEAPLWDGALQYARAEIVQDFLDHGTSPTRATHSGLSPIQALANGLSQSWNLPWAVQTQRPIAEYPTMEAFERAIIETYEVLKAAGADTERPHPGEFKVDDLSPAGHTVWSRAVAHRKWHLAAHVFPESWAALQVQPRGVEAVAHLHKCANDHMVKYPHEIRDPLAQLWLHFLNRYLADWLQETPDAFEQPEDWTWLRYLSVADRQVLWQHWSVPDEEGWTGLHRLALQGGEPSATEAIRWMAQDDAPCLALWDVLNIDGISPASLWALARAQRTGQSVDSVVTDWQAIALQAEMALEAAEAAPSAVPAEVAG